MKKLSFSILLFAFCFLLFNTQTHFAAGSAKSRINVSAIKSTIKTGRQLPAGKKNRNIEKKSLSTESGQQTVLWQQVSSDELKDTDSLALTPEKFLVFRLNKKALTELLALVPAESQDLAQRNALIEDNAVVIKLPMPDGTLARFRIEESSVLEPSLAAQFPEIKSYRGQGVDDPTLTTRFDLTAQGFHALILSGGEAVNVEPGDKKDASLYVSYNGDAIKDKDVSCLVENFHNEKFGMTELDSPERDSAQIAVGGILRNYRIAIGADFEYTQTYGNNTVSGTVSSINTWLNGANAIYEKELSIHLNLVNNTNIIYSADRGFSATTDPYDNSNVGTMLNNAIDTTNGIDATVGRTNYDVGHVFGTAPSGYLGSGIAYIGVVNANSNLKGGGATQLGSSLGNSGALGVWVHEIGHQFGANHNFNGTQANCGPGQHNDATSYETGSGSTIMAYSGICGSDNITTSRDMRFHPMSYLAINNYITARAGNFTGTATGNSAPTVSGGGNRNIPKNTPFILTAIGSDPNGDTLTYSWDEIDAGGTSYPQDGTDASYIDTNDPVGTTRPIFRSFAPVGSPSRTFPQLGYILDSTYANDPPNTLPNGLKSAEELPRVGRTLNFRVTARDNRLGGGGVNEDTVVLTVDNNSGPFLVTSPNTNVTYSGASSQTVTWSVNNTNVAPISAANVKISLSTDGGNTFPTVLAASTPNDGSETVTLPNITTSTARIKVEAVGNVFFDIGNTNFTINASTVVTNYEADVSPRSAGDTFIDANDIQEIRRFSVGLDTPYQSNEFQRADCSPRSSSGDGFIDANDIQQARRYSVGLDVKQPAGGTGGAMLFENWTAAGQRADETSAADGDGTAAIADSTLAPLASDVRVESGATGNNSGTGTVTVPIRVDVDGSESGFTFSLSYDGTKLSNPVVSIGTAGGDVVTNITAQNPNVNPIGFSVTGFTGGTIGAGANRLLVTIRFNIAANAAPGMTALTFGDTPTPRRVSGADPNVAQTQPSFTSGTASITAPTAAQASISGRAVSAGGRGIGGATILLTEPSGAMRTRRTNAFGYYEFGALEAGATYIVTARAKRYAFAPNSRVLSIQDDVGSIDFIGTPIGW